jgi:hypothetical protein
MLSTVPADSLPSAMRSLRYSYTCMYLRGSPLWRRAGRFGYRKAIDLLPGRAVGTLEAWLLLSRPDTLDAGEQAQMADVQDRCPHLHALGGPVPSFAEMMTRRRGQQDLKPGSPPSKPTTSPNCVGASRSSGESGGAVPDPATSSHSRLWQVGRSR